MKKAALAAAFFNRERYVLMRDQNAFLTLSFTSP